MTDKLLTLLLFLVVGQLLLLPFVARRIKQRHARLASGTSRPNALERLARDRPWLFAVVVGAILAAGVAVFGYFAHVERAARYAEHRAFRLGEARERFVQRWGAPSDDLSIHQLERKWGYRAVEERGDRTRAVTYLVWWGRVDIATARVVGFDEAGRAVLLSWGGT